LQNCQNTYEIILIISLLLGNYYNIKLIFSHHYLLLIIIAYITSLSTFSSIIARCNDIAIQNSIISHFKTRANVRHIYVAILIFTISLGIYIVRLIYENLIYKSTWDLNSRIQILRIRRSLRQRVILFSSEGGTINYWHFFLARRNQCCELWSSSSSTRFPLL